MDMTVNRQLHNIPVCKSPNLRGGGVKPYNQAPLPFQGQKRFWKKDFTRVLREHFASCHTFIDLFGGSGLLSHYAREARPDARVVCNDFDNYTARLAAIPQTNRLIAGIREMLAEWPDGKRVEEPCRSRVLERIRAEEEACGYVDYITLSASLLFSTKYATSFETLRKNGLYNTVRSSDYSADGYLDGVEVVRMDYRELYGRWRGVPGVAFLVDPPYLSTDTTTYTGYWRLKDYLDVLNVLDGGRFVYFTSDKSGIVELCDWLEHNMAAANPFSGTVRLTRQAWLNHSSAYRDIMLYKCI